MKKDRTEKMMASINDKYIAEAITGNNTQKATKEHTVLALKKIATAAAVIIILLGTGISVAAATSNVFRNWLTKSFGGHEISKVEIIAEKTQNKDTSADVPADENSHLCLEDNMEIYGQKESFVCQFHLNNDDIVVDNVFSIQNNGLKKLKLRSFHGKYDGIDFSFEYAIINQEILGFNSKGAINQIFHYVNKDIVYVSLCQIEGDTVEKGCIARLNLKSGDVTKLTKDTTIGNMVMSPKGKVILINYRSDGYWTAFRTDNCTERKIEEINGYAHTNEVVFQDDYHVLTLAEPYIKENTEIMGTIIVDLQTGKKTASYKDCGDYSPEWLYQQEKGKLTVKHVNGETAICIDNVTGYPHPLSTRGNYVLLGNLEEQNTPFYLCNLAKKWYMEIDIPPELEDNVQIHLAAKERKALLTDGKEAYLVDISKNQN